MTNVPQWVKDMENGFNDDPETAKQYEVFKRITAEGINEVFDAVGEQFGAMMMLLMAQMTPRVFAEEHVACLCCGEGDSDNCPAKKIAQNVTKYADEIGHPEWVDGDPLLEDDLPQV